MRNGSLRFARYALAPNRLGYCGPDQSEALFEQAVALGGSKPDGSGGGSGDAGLVLTPGGDDAGGAVVGGGSAGGGVPVWEVLGELRELAEAFEGAWPYLELIAEASGIRDPLDDRVVTAYWLGGPALEHVAAGEAGRHATERFRPRAGRWWSQVEAALAGGAAPSHAFHVMVVGPWVGMLRGGVVDAPVTVIDSCRIRRGRVLEVSGDNAVVSTDRVDFGSGRLSVGAEAVDPVTVRLGEAGDHPCGPVCPGDLVALHWDWVCERIDAPTAAAIGRAEARALDAANTALATTPHRDLG